MLVLTADRIVFGQTEDYFLGGFRKFGRVPIEQASHVSFLHPLAIEEVFGDQTVCKIDQTWIGGFDLRDHVARDLQHGAVEDELLLFAQDVDDGGPSLSDHVKAAGIDFVGKSDHEFLKLLLLRRGHCVPHDDIVVLCGLLID